MYPLECIRFNDSHPHPDQTTGDNYYLNDSISQIGNSYVNALGPRLSSMTQVYDLFQERLKSCWVTFG